MIKAGYKRMASNQTEKLLIRKCPFLIVSSFFDNFSATYKRKGVGPSGSVCYTFDDGFIHQRFRLPPDNVIGPPSTAGIGLGDI